MFRKIRILIAGGSFFSFLPNNSFVTRFTMILTKIAEELVAPCYLIIFKSAVKICSSLNVIACLKNLFSDES
ncbi:hypothetical protein AM499_07000 [Bacillus sp. FJAT-22090]|nr:hypothetical protein AM499_07000 [Bacillus sp. FJAT-22090]